MSIFLKNFIKHSVLLIHGFFWFLGISFFFTHPLNYLSHTVLDIDNQFLAWLFSEDLENIFFGQHSIFSQHLLLKLCLFYSILYFSSLLYLIFLLTRPGIIYAENTNFLIFIFRFSFSCILLLFGIFFVYYQIMFFYKIQSVNWIFFNTQLDLLNIWATQFMAYPPDFNNILIFLYLFMIYFLIQKKQYFFCYTPFYTSFLFRYLFIFSFINLWSLGYSFFVVLFLLFIVFTFYILIVFFYHLK